MTQVNETAKRNRMLMVGMFFLFLVPVLIAWWIFSVDDGDRSSDTTNAGHLITPARPLPVDIVLQAPDGAALPPDYLKGRWTIVYIGSSSCDDFCQEVLARARQVRLAMGEDTERVQRLFLVADAGGPLDGVQEQDPDLMIGQASGPEAAPLLELFQIDDHPVINVNRTYLVDPLGNLMMYYEPTDPPNGILRDLRHLLKWSQIG